MFVSYSSLSVLLSIYFKRKKNFLLLIVFEKLMKFLSYYSFDFASAIPFDLRLKTIGKSRVSNFETETFADVHVSYVFFHEMFPYR